MHGKHRCLRHAKETKCAKDLQSFNHAALPIMSYLYSASSTLIIPHYLSWSLSLMVAFILCCLARSSSRQVLKHTLHRDSQKDEPDGAKAVSVKLGLHEGPLWCLEWTKAEKEKRPSQRHFVTAKTDKSRRKFDPTPIHAKRSRTPAGSSLFFSLLH